MDEYLIHLPPGFENDGVPVFPDDAPQCHGCPYWELAKVVYRGDDWLPEAVAGGLTLAEARNLAHELRVTRIIGDYELEVA